MHRNFYLSMLFIIGAMFVEYKPASVFAGFASSVCFYIFTLDLFGALLKEEEQE